MRRLVTERLCLMLGSALVLAAVCLYVYDRLEDARAGAQAASAVSQLRQSQSIAAVSEAEQPAAAQTDAWNDRRAVYPGCSSDDEGGSAGDQHL